MNKKQTLFNKLMKSKMQIIALNDKITKLSYEIEVKDIELTRDDLFTPDELLLMSKKLNIRKSYLDNYKTTLHGMHQSHNNLCEQYDKLQSKGKK